MTRLLIVVACSALAVPTLAAGQCRSDTDCKGDRICVSSQCVDPVRPEQKTRAAQPFAVAEREQVLPDPGWGKTGAVVGILGGAGALTLALASEQAQNQGRNGTALGTVGVLLAIPSMLVASSAGTSVKGVERSSGLRIVGWTAFGLAMIDAGYLIGLGMQDVPVPRGYTTATGVLGLIGIGCMGIDAFAAASEAEVRLEALRKSRAAYAPSLVPIRGHDGRLVAGFGMAGRF